MMNANLNELLIITIHINIIRENIKITKVRFVLYSIEGTYTHTRIYTLKKYDNVNCIHRCFYGLNVFKTGATVTHVFNKYVHNGPGVRIPARAHPLFTCRTRCATMRIHTYGDHV